MYIKTCLNNIIKHNINIYIYIYIYRALISNWFSIWFHCFVYVCYLFLQIVACVLYMLYMLFNNCDCYTNIHIYNKYCKSIQQMFKHIYIYNDSFYKYYKQTNKHHLTKYAKKW